MTGDVSKLHNNNGFALMDRFRIDMTILANNQAQPPTKTEHELPQPSFNPIGVGGHNLPSLFHKAIS